MSESSRSRVTITLGRSGQVVKRDGGAFNTSTDFSPVVGNKRSIRERLGSNVDSSANIGNKRQRGDDINSFSDTHLRKDDLRYKIMRKNMQKQSRNSQQSNMDLRSLLSRPAQSSVNSVSTQQRMPEKNDKRMHHLELERPQPKAGETSGGRGLMPLTRTSGQHILEFRAQHTSDPRQQHSLRAKEGDRKLLEAEDVIRSVRTAGSSRAIADIPGMRTSNAVPRRESGVSSYSAWTLDRIRQRSPDESLAASRGVSVSQRDEEFQRRYAARTYDDSRTSSYLGKDAVEFSRPVSSAHMTKMAPPVRPMKSMEPMPAPLPPRSVAPSRSYLVDDPPTVDSFLRALGLEKYAILFKAEEVDMFSLKRMAEKDLKDLGIPMGPRKKILLTLHPNLRQQA